MSETGRGKLIVISIASNILTMDGHILKTLLQLQLASDTSAILHLPYTLSSLTKQSLLPSSHTQKWIARLSSLLHSKDAGARWAGLCLANRTCSLASDILIECGQSWISTALQLLMVRPHSLCCVEALTYLAYRKQMCFQ